MRKNWLFIILVVVTIAFFYPIFIKGLLPIPSDTIVGLYHPFRDFYSKVYTRGVPYKNSLITDPVRQQYPWRNLSISLEKNLQLPLWNPYNLAGTPLLANFQSAVFYPFNILLYILPFSIGWTLMIILQPLLCGIFLYLFLKQLKLDNIACFLGAITYAFCGFSIAWMEWNTLVQVAIWLPLLLLAKEKLLTKISPIWIFIFLFAECSAIFAGHLQTYFYFFLVSNGYLLARIFQISAQEKTQKDFISVFYKKYASFGLLGLVVFIVTAVQWLPTFHFISESARDVDQINNWVQDGWFIPWQHLIQFIAPDFFGSPTTGNYWGTWNYGEFIGYVGIMPLIFALFALFFRRDKKTLFFGSLFFLSLIFSLPTFLAKIPYLLHIPFISTAQPTRLLFVTDFSLAILAALGLDRYLQNKKGFWYPALFVLIIIGTLWGFIFFEKNLISPANISTVKRNLVLPTLLVIGCISVLFVMNKNKKTNLLKGCLVIILLITLFDLFRFGWKFIPFTSSTYIYPNTKSIFFIKEHIGYYRIMTTDSRILPPNFSIMYHIQSIDGYDPLYLRRYGELIAASERKKADISGPFGFNRIITPHQYDSKIIDLLGVKYVLSLSDISSPKLLKVFQEGDTRVYENKNVLPRVFFAERVVLLDRKEDVIQTIFQDDINLSSSAIIELSSRSEQSSSTMSKGKAVIHEYLPNKIIINIENNQAGFLVLTDSFYPSWKAYFIVNGQKNQTHVYRTDYNFRGVYIPAKTTQVVFYNTLDLFVN